MAAGFDVVGIDIADHSAIYPGDFIRGDALRPPVRLADFDFVWASPPCQAHSVAGAQHAARHADLIPATRALLSGHPYTCMENVPEAPLRPDLILTMSQFGYNPGMYRRRFFEVSWPVLSPPPIRPAKKAKKYSVTTSMSSKTHYYWRREAGLSGRLSPAEACALMGIGIPMTAAQVGEAVPPKYAEYIGHIAVSNMLLNNENGGLENG